MQLCCKHRQKRRFSNHLAYTCILQTHSDDGSRGPPSPVPEVTRKAGAAEPEEEEYEMEIYKLSMSGPQKKENLCGICEQTGDLMECQGPCQGYFHMDCLGMNVKPNGEFKCDECTSGKVSF